MGYCKNIYVCTEKEAYMMVILSFEEVEKLPNKYKEKLAVNRDNSYKK